LWRHGKEPAWVEAPITGVTRLHRYCEPLRHG
jgi:hypothetical protein